MIKVPFGQTSQRIVDLLIDLNPFKHEARPRRVSPLPRNTRISSTPIWRGVVLIISIRLLTSRRRYSSAGTNRSGLNAMNT